MLYLLEFPNLKKSKLPECFNFFAYEAQMLKNTEVSLEQMQCMQPSLLRQR